MAPLNRRPVVTLSRDDHRYPVPQKQVDAILSATLTLKRFAFDLVHRIKRKTQYAEWRECLGLPSL